MRHQLPLVLYTLQLLLVGASSLPASSTSSTTPQPTAVDWFFTDPNAPVLSDLFLTNPTVEDRLESSSSPSRRDDDSGSVKERSGSVKYIKYSITIDGRNTINWVPFRVTGYMLVTQGISSPGTTNGANYNEVLISIGNPIGNPIAGSLHYATNRGLYTVFSGKYGLSLLDFAYVSLSNQGATVSVTVDSTLAPANPLSIFNARSGLTAAAWLVAGGGFKFTVYSNGALAGSINLKGRGFIEPGNGKTPYVGNINGQFLGRGTLYL